MDEQVLQQDALIQALNNGEDLSGKHIGKLHLAGQVISYPANFAWCFFDEDVNCVDTVFARGVSFQGATFIKKSDFKNAELSGILPSTSPLATFESAVFHNKALFDNATFNRIC